MTSNCGCCTTPAAAIPAEIANRPGLSAIAHRIGTFATFRKAILDELSQTPELRALTARVSDDYTVTAVELWAAVADVLTFYEERTANEGFLRTATLRDSMLRLVRLLDYQLRPGAAATTAVAFTLDRGATALIAAETRIQSIPAEAEKPQKFETVAPLMASARLNKLRVFPEPFPVKPLGAGTEIATIAPDAEALIETAALAPGERVMLYAPNAFEVLTVREIRAQDDLLTVRWTIPIQGLGFGAAFDGANVDFRAYRLGRAFHLFGVDALPTVVVPELKVPGDATTSYLTTALTDYSLHGDGTLSGQIALDGRYPGLKAGSVVLAVSSVGASLVAIPFQVTGASEKPVQRNAKTTTALGTLVMAHSGTVTVLDLSPLGAGNLTNLVPPGDIRNVVVYELNGAPLRFWPYGHAGTVASNDLFLPGTRAGWSSVEVGRVIEKGAAKPGTFLDLTDFETARPVLLADQKGGAPVMATIAGASLVGSGLDLQPAAADEVTIRTIGLAADQSIPVTVILSRPLGSPIVFPNLRREVTVTIGQLPAQTIVLDPAILGGGSIANVAAALQTAIRAALPASPTFARALAWVIDDSIAFSAGVPGDRVAFGPSINDPATILALGLDAAHARFLDGVVSAAVAPLPGPFVSGFVRVKLGIDPAADRPITPAATVGGLAAAIATMGIITKVTADNRIIVLPPLPKREPRIFLRLALHLEGPLALDAPTAVLLGNVAPATHGETVRAEIVGDGDAAQAFQRFTLKKKPVTYVPAATPGGTASSLRVFVNAVKWTEVPSLYPAGPRDQVYITRIADDGALTVQFGDGVTGARVPTGRQNIVAWYRQGIGLAGRVGAMKLTTLLDRPTGVKDALNLTATDGGADPETMDRAREAAPGTVRTFGRAVSLRDFEDTALMAGEVAKASATWVWNGDRRLIHLTIAAQQGATFSREGLKRIAATLATERDPNHKLVVDNYAPVAVLVDATIRVDARYLANQVLDGARAALLAELSFNNRRFTEPVYLSVVFRVLQDVEGVLAVDVNVLDLKSKDGVFRAAHGVDDTLPQPQSRLLMLPAHPVGSSGAVLPAELAWVEAPDQDVTLRAIGGLSL